MRVAPLLLSHVRGDHSPPEPHHGRLHSHSGRGRALALLLDVRGEGEDDGILRAGVGRAYARRLRPARRRLAGKYASRLLTAPIAFVPTYDDHWSRRALKHRAW